MKNWDRYFEGTDIYMTSSRPLSSFPPDLVDYLRRPGGSFADERHSYRIDGNTLIRMKTPSKNPNTHRMIFKTFLLKNT